jgi:hypothetical protein
VNALRRLLAALHALLDRWAGERFEIPKVLPAPSPGTTIVTVNRDVVAGEMLTTADVIAHRPNRPGPLLVVDFSHWDEPVTVEAIDALLADRRYVGAWIKLTQGARGYAHEAFGVGLVRMLIARARACGRLGVDFFIGIYGYLAFDVDGGAQADYLYRVAKTCGWLALPAGSRLRAMMDVERGQAGSANYDDGGAKVTACAEAFTRRWYALTDARPVGYGRGAWRDLHLRGLLGCDGVVNPAYTRDMPPMEAYGVPRAEVIAQQYTDGETNKTNLPTLPPGVHACDSSVVLGPQRGQLADLETVIRRLTC